MPHPDVIIIGAGCIGASIARELSKYQLSVLVLEAADDITQGATKGNSGIVHAGFDDTPGTNRAKFCWPGNQMFADLDRDLHFGYQRNGSLVVATNAEECAHLEELLKRGLTNGVQNLRIINQEELRVLEPAVNPNAIAALLSPDAGNLIPYEYTIAMMENAVDNGVETRIRRQVTAIEPSTIEDSVSASTFKVTCKYWEPASYVQASGGIEAVRHTGARRENESSHENGILKNSFIAAVIILLCSGAGTDYGLFPAIIAKVDPAVFGTYSVLHQHAVTILTSVVVLIYAVAFLPSRSSGKKRGNSSAFLFSAPVGAGGKIVSVEEMKVGGSGSCDVMDGQVIGEEVYRARFVVNCAGSYSDAIAAVSTFQI